MALPVYDPGGTQRTEAVGAVNASPDAFGAGIGRALQGTGETLQGVGAKMAKLEAEQKAKDDTTAVMDAYTQGSSQLRDALYNPEGGMYSRSGANAVGVTADIQQTSETIRSSLERQLKTPEQKEAFRQMWQRKDESTIEGAAKFEFGQNEAYRKEVKSSALANIDADVVANYRNPEALKANFDAARAMINANPDGMSPEGVARLKREAVSGLHLQVIQRLAQDNPGEALDYYTAHKGEVGGPDHAQADRIIGGVAQIRDAKAGATEIMGGGKAGDIVGAVIGAESGGDASAVSPAGALGLMQVMPDTAREVAAQIGLPSVARMSDDELQTYFASKEGQMSNKRIGTAYLNKQLATFNGDLEAALVAYNAGPANAEKWLDAGRDYKVLPKPDETYPYVGKVLGAYLKIDPASGTMDGGGYQGAIKTGPKRFSGDAASFLKTRLPNKGSSHVDGMTPIMQDSLAAMFDGAPDFVKDGLDIMSGTRTVERQTELWNAALQKYGSVAAARKWVAPPPGVEGSKGSQHNHGQAADLGWNGGKFRNAPPEVRQWVKDNAAAFGLTFPMGHEPWHIEPVGARSGKGPRLGSQEAIQARISAANGDDAPVTVMLPAGAVRGAADVYTNIAAPYQVASTDGDLNSWLDQARERFANDPGKLAEVERQLTLEWNGREATQKAEVQSLTMEVFRGIMGGQNVADFDPKMLQQIGPDGVSKLLTLEGKFKPGAKDETDDATYIAIRKMTPEEFAAANFIDYADKLSGSDLRRLADEQAAIKRPGDKKDANISGMRTGTQIFSDASNILNLKPETNTVDAAASVALRRQFDEQIAAYAAANGNAPDAVEMQKMMDRLLLQGKLEQFGPDPQSRTYELSPETASRFMVEGVTAETFDDVPPAAHGAIASTYRKIWQYDPDETAALDLYNDVARINLGAFPLPPDDLKSRISQGLFSKLGRVPSDQEIAATYKRLIEKASAP